MIIMKKPVQIDMALCVSYFVFPIIINHWIVLLLILWKLDGFKKK